MIKKHNDMRKLIIKLFNFANVKLIKMRQKTMSYIFNIRKQIIHNKII